MKVIVTGGTGFLGRHLCKALNKRNNEVTLIGSKDADLTVQDSLLRFNHTKYDRIYHLAAWTQAGDFCVHHPGEQWMINQQINTTVLTWWHQHQSQAKLVSMGTSCSYQEGVDLRESRYLDGIPREELYVYAMTKRMLLIGQQSLHRQFGLNYLTLVPSTLYGPDYHTGGEQMHFIFD